MSQELEAVSGGRESSGRWARGTAAVRRGVMGVRRLGRVSVLTGLAGVMPPAGGFLLLGTLPLVGPWLAEQQAWGVVLYVSAFVLFAGLALLPTYAQAILGGAAFGFAVGFPAAMVGFSGAAALSYVVTGRITGRHMIDVIEENPRWKAVHTALVGSGTMRTLWLVALLRLPPMSPFAMVNVVLASARVPRLPYLLGTMLGLAPRIGVIVYIASAVARFDPADYRSTVHLVVGIVVSVVVLIVLGHMARRAVRRMTEAPQGEAEGEQASGECALRK